MKVYMAVVLLCALLMVACGDNGDLDDTDGDTMDDDNDTDGDDCGAWLPEPDGVFVRAEGYLLEYENPPYDFWFMFVFDDNEFIVGNETAYVFYGSPADPMQYKGQRVVIYGHTESVSFPYWKIGTPFIVAEQIYLAGGINGI